MSKVKLPRAVAEELAAIDLHESYPIRFVVDVFNKDINGEVGALKEYFESDRSRRIAIIMSALIEGYEIEETPEDKVRDYFIYCQNSSAPEIRSEMYGIRNTLILLNIKISGVNAE